jgi:hypothetical protein
VGLINWIFDIYQQTQIDKLRDARAQVMATPAPGGNEIDRLERAVGELALAVKTMQRMIVEKNVCTATELKEKLNQLDLEDGRADGRAPIQ